ncbi:MAG: hypothetical protein H6565_15690 [Lewinellaceae bacterium]|nr:hypothetical protein [Lewinellaceae bacterium]
MSKTQTQRCKPVTPGLRKIPRQMVDAVAFEPAVRIVRPGSYPSEMKRYAQPFDEYFASKTF